MLEIVRNSPLDAPVTEDLVEEIFEILLKRPTGNSGFRAQKAKSGISVGQFLREIRNSPELRGLAAREARSTPDGKRHALSMPENYRAPDVLRVGETPVRNVLMVGTCLIEAFKNVLRSASPELGVDLYLLSSALPAQTERPIDSYQFQIVQLPLRSIIPDFQLARLSQLDTAGHEQAFERAKDALNFWLDRSMQWNKEHGILTFVFAFPVPQQNPIGRLLPRYDLRNPVYFIERLNQYLSERLTTYKQAHLFDINDIAATYGKRFAAEDQYISFNHGGVINSFDFGLDQNRLEPVTTGADAYGGEVNKMFHAVWNEMVACYRTIRQIDSIKLVVFDLDDTLWRGVIADTDPESLPTAEGWPKSLWDALLILKRRGILLAINSKNEESRVREVWSKIFGTKGLTLDDFAAVKINWRLKSENMADILAATNLLPGNVLFIDDNPAQRDEIKRAYPAIRVLGGNPIHWRHVLLWAPETQVASITNESAARTEMIQAQVEREAQRKTQSPEEFLRSLEIQMTVFEVASVDHPRFSRVIELINKTNQFNTTGKRWTVEECLSALKGGTRFLAFEVTDRFTEYGLVAVMIVDASGIVQFVMSCRVMNLDVELAAIAYVSGLLKDAGAREVFARMVHTERNLPCRDIYSRSGFTAAEGGWVYPLATGAPNVPEHITLTRQG